MAQFPWPCDRRDAHEAHTRPCDDRACHRRLGDHLGHGCDGVMAHPATQIGGNYR